MATTKRIRRKPQRQKTSRHGLVRDEFQYLLVTPNDRRWGLCITAAGAQFISPHANFRSQGHSPSHDYLWKNGRALHEYSIVYVIRGEGEFEAENSRLQKLTPGSVVFLTPNVWHRYRPVEEIGFDHYWVMFEGDYADTLRKQGLLFTDTPVLDAGMDESILRPFVSLLDHVRSQPAGFRQMAAADLLAIIAGIHSVMQCRYNVGHVQDAIHRAKLAIETADVPDLKNIIMESGLGRSSFYRMFKDSTGLSPYQYHLQWRMSRARELLRNSSLSIERIAAMLHFSSVYQFSRIFANKNGVPPSRYRRDILDRPAR